MGYKRETKLYRLKFADSAMDGLVVDMKSLSTGAFLEVAELADTFTGQKLADMDVSAMRKVFEVLAGALVSWNLEDEHDKPIPTTYDGIVSQEFDFVLEIFMAWVGAMSSVDIPLPAGSNSGATSPEASLPMEPL
jgi:hypothetical protein